MLACISDKSAEVRQAAGYGVGVMAQFGGPMYAQALSGTVDTGCLGGGGGEIHVGTFFLQF
jgi:hypothetical protein